MRVAVPTPGTLLAFFGGNLIPVDSLEKAFEEEIGLPVTSLQPSDSRLATSTKTETDHPAKQLIREALAGIIGVSLPVADLHLNVHCKLRDGSGHVVF